MFDFIHQLSTGPLLLPYLLVFVSLLACGFGLPVPEDLALIAAGIASYYGYGNVYLMIAVSFAGIMTGDTILFFLGRRFGDTIKDSRLFRRFVDDAALRYIEGKLENHGSKVVFAARFMPGLRAPIYFTAGLMKIKFTVFFTFDFLAGLISVPAIVYTVYYFGENIDSVVRTIKRIEHGIMILAFCIFALVAVHAYLSFGKLKKARESGGGEGK